MTINWELNDTDEQLIRKIVDRFAAIHVQLDAMKGFDFDHHVMNLAMCHLNGCRLNLQGLLDADRYGFIHDMQGIDRCINRENGRLEKFFMPLFAAKAE